MTIKITIKKLTMNGIKTEEITLSTNDALHIIIDVADQKHVDDFTTCAMHLDWCEHK